MECLGEQWKKSNDLKEMTKKKKRSQPNLLFNASSFREESDRIMSTRKVINQIENQKKVKQILYDLQVNDIEGINLSKLMDEVADKHKKCEELYDQIYQRKKILEKNKGDGKIPQERDLNIQDQKQWKRRNLNKYRMNEEYNKKIDRAQETQKKIRDEINIFKENGLNVLENILQKKEKEVKKNILLNDDEVLCEKMTEIDRILSNFMFQDMGQAYSMNGESSRTKKYKSVTFQRPEKQSHNLENSRLEQILHANKNSKNTTNIYSSEQFIEISKITLQKEAKSFRDSERETNSIRK